MTPRTETNMRALWQRLALEYRAQALVATDPAERAAALRNLVTAAINLRAYGVDLWT